MRARSSLPTVAFAAVLAGCGTHHAPAATRPARAPVHHARKRSVVATAAAQQAALDRLSAQGRPVFCGARHGHLVALTFDDGPGRYTHLALRRLRAEHAHATFFLVGTSVDRYPDSARPETTLAAIGDHTATHANLAALAPAQARNEILAGRYAARKATGQPVRMLRPPFGAHSPAVDAIVRRAGMVEVLWDVDSEDSRTAPPADFHEIAANVRRELRPGSIVLLHENRGQSIRALRSIFRTLRHRGLRSVSVPELLAADPPTAKQLAAGPDGCGIGKEPSPSSG